MAWWLKYGGKVSDTHDGEVLGRAAWLAAAAAENGDEPPEAIKEMPSLCYGAREPWEAFQVLTKRRPLWSLGMGGAIPGHIPVSEINAYIRDNLGIQDADEHNFIFQCIDALDDEYVRHVNEEYANKLKTDGG